jgi:hypothetical protein
MRLFILSAINFYFVICIDPKHPILRDAGRLDQNSVNSGTCAAPTEMAYVTFLERM